MEDLLAEVNNVFQKVFKRGDLDVSADTTADDVPGWDSLTHMALIAAIEDHFDLLFTFEEVREFNNVGDLVDLIHQKQGK